MKARPWAPTTLVALALTLVSAGAADAIEFSVERSPLEPSLHRRVVGVMEHYYNFEFDEALTGATAIRADYPTHPAGHFLMSEIHWWQAINDTDRPAHVSAFDEASARVISVCEKRLDKDDRDALALFFLGGAEGRRAILAAMNGKHLEAVRTSLNGRKFIKRLNKYHKDVEDAYFGLGLYNYYSAELPWFARVLGRLFLGLSGDKERGLAELERAAEHGLFTQVEARIFLSIIYLDAEGRYDDAIAILKELNETYPANLNFYGLLGFAYRTRHDHANALSMLETLNERAEVSEVYGRRSRSIATYFLGSTYKFAGLLERAKKTLGTVVEKESDGTNNWLLAVSLLERGRVHDLLGERQAALEDYRAVLERKSFRSSHDRAHEYMDTPYVAPDDEAEHYISETALGSGSNGDSWQPDRLNNEVPSSAPDAQTDSANHH